MRQEKLENLFDYLPKSKIKAGDGLEDGKYPFYTSSENQSKYLDAFQHGPGCLVFGTGGKASVHLTKTHFSTSTDCIAIKPKATAGIDVGYVFHYFKGNMQILDNGFKGAGLKHISKAYLSKIQIPYPEDINDQIRITQLLGKVEGLIAQRKQHLVQLEDLLKSLFLEMFGDPIKNPHNYPVKKLSNFYINPKEGTKCGPFGSALKKNEYVDSGTPVWNMDNIDPTGRMLTPFRMWITSEKFNELSSYSVIDGDIIISRAGTVGKMCVAKMNGEAAIISTNLIRLRLGDKLRPLHFVSLMTYCKGRVGRLKVGADGAFTHMNTGILDKLEFPYPPTELQDKFATIVEKVEALKLRYQQSLNDLKSLYGSLSQQAFKGELDLSQVPLPESEHSGDEVVATDPETEAQTADKTIAVHLPESHALPDALTHNAKRKDLFAVWLESYCQQIGNTPFSASDFLTAAQTRMTELHPDSEFEMGANDYDMVKDWVFENIRTRKLKQTREIIFMNEKRKFGNRVLLRSRRPLNQ